MEDGNAQGAMCSCQGPHSLAVVAFIRPPYRKIFLCGGVSMESTMDLRRLFLPQTKAFYEFYC